jgi:hypothetical protein
VCIGNLPLLTGPCGGQTPQEATSLAGPGLTEDAMAATLAPSTWVRCRQEASESFLCILLGDIHRPDLKTHTHHIHAHFLIPFPTLPHFCLLSTCAQVTVGGDPDPEAWPWAILQHTAVPVTETPGSQAPPSRTPPPPVLRKESQPSSGPGTGRTKCMGRQ